MRVVVRSWLIRGLILAGVAVLVALGMVANSWVSPERVREQVIATLNEQLNGVEVHVGSARMRILGGIAVKDLKLVRVGGSAGQPFLFVPSAVLYHDKEQLNRGRLVIKRVDLENPELHIERTADGQWNVTEILRAGPADRPVPTFVVKGATVTVTDHVPNGLPPLRLTEARLTVLNDPLPVLSLHAQGAAQGYGAVEVRARLNRVTRHASIGLDFTDFPLGEVAAVAAERFAPALAPYLGKLAATAAVKADLTYTPGTPQAWRHDVRFEIKNGRLEHPNLPWAVDKIAAKVRSVDGWVKVEEATARVGTAQVKVSLETRNDLAMEGRVPIILSRDRGASSHAGKAPAAPAPPTEEGSLALLEEHIQRADVTVSGVALDDTLFTRLGAVGAKAKQMFSPVGAVDVGYKFGREAAGWKREFEIRPRSVTVKYEKFPYPLTDVAGWVKRTVTHAGGEATQVDIFGTAAGQRVTVKGQLSGDGPDPAINLRIAGNNLPLDDALIAAIPGKYPDLIRQFRATGRADFVAEIAQKAGVNLCENEFRVEIRDATVNYSQFPYLMEKVNGRVVVRVAASDPKRPVRPNEPRRPLTDRDELILDRFTGTHGGATVSLQGSKRPVPGSRDRKLVLEIRGAGCGIDEDLQKALKGLKLDEIWTTFSPQGSLTFAAEVEALDRAAPLDRPNEDPSFNPASDLRLTFRFSGPAVTPSFFPYALADTSGWLIYQNGRVNLGDFSGRHGQSRLKLATGDVRFYLDGRVYADLQGLEVKPFLADATFLKALPGKLRSAADELKLKGGAALSVKQLVVLTPPDPPPGSTRPPPEPLPIAPAVSQPATPTGQERRPTGTSWAPPASPGSSPPRQPLAGTRVSPVARGQVPISPVAAAPPQPLPVLYPSTSANALPAPKPLAPASSTLPDPEVYWDAELKLAGASFDTGVPWEDLFGSVACKGEYKGTHLGVVRGNLWFDRAVVARQPVSNVQSHVYAEAQKPDPNRPGQFMPSELQFTNVAGNLFHGAVGGKAHVVLADQVRYELWLIATDVQLDEVARHYKLGSDADLKGVAQAKIRLYNRPDPRTGAWVVEGAGNVDVPTGRMYNLPILLDLVKVFKFSAPDKTAFEEAHAAFRIIGDRVRVDQLDLIGKAVCVGGAGEVDTSGEYVKFEFYTLGSQILARLVNTPVGDLSAFMSKNLFKIRMTRENGELRYRPEPVPVVTEPTRAVIDRLKNLTGRSTGK